jgi:hypothetical protein
MLQKALKKAGPALRFSEHMGGPPVLCSVVISRGNLPQRVPG